MEIRINRRQYAEFLHKAYQLNRMIEPLEKTPYIRIVVGVSGSEHVILSSIHNNNTTYSKCVDCIAIEESNNPNRIFTWMEALKPIYMKLMLESEDECYTFKPFPRLAASSFLIEELPYYKNEGSITITGLDRVYRG